MSRGGGKLANLVRLMVELPLLAIVLLLSPVYLALFKSLRRIGVLRDWRRLSVLNGEITFSWSCKNTTEAKDALVSAISALVDLLPQVSPLSEVVSVQLLNPELGMVLEQRCLERITSNFGATFGYLLLGNKVEHGAILINDELRLENLDLDSRSSIVGHLSVELPSSPGAEVLSEVASRHSFQLQSGVT